MFIVVRLSVAASMAVSLGFAWTVGQSGLQQTNRNLCELWNSLPLWRYDSCEFQYVLVGLWLFAAIASVIWLLFEASRVQLLRNAAGTSWTYARRWTLERVRKLEPSHLITIGVIGAAFFAAIAVAGIVWQLLRTPRDDPKITALQSEIGTLRTQLTEAQRPRTSPTRLGQQQVDVPQPDPRVAELQRELDGARRELESARQAIRTPPPPATIQGPINWHPEFQIVAIGGGPNATITALVFQGTSSALVQMKEASLYSELTGHREPLMVNLPYRGGTFPVDQVDIPPSAGIQLIIEWKPGLSITSFLDEWGKMTFTATYNDFTHRTTYDEDHVRRILRSAFPDAIGARVTPKKGAEK